MKKYLLVSLAVVVVTACQNHSVSKVQEIPFSEVKNTEEQFEKLPKAEKRERFVSEFLGISFEIPAYISGCQESQEDYNGIQVIDEFVSKGYLTSISCDDYQVFMLAASKDYKAYEYTINPEHQKVEELEQYFPDHYRLEREKGEPLNIFAMASAWGYGGEHFALGTYYPLHGNQYDTLRITLYLSDVSKEGVVDKGNILDMPEYENFVDEYVNKILSKDLPSEDLKKVRDFEKMLLSIKKES